MSDSKKYDKTIRKIFSILSNCSRSQEYMLHSRNVLQWAEKVAQKKQESGFNPVHLMVDDAVRIAALGHSIECATDEEVQRADYSKYTAYKQASAKKSSEIIRKIMQEYEYDADMIARTTNIIANYEEGNDKYSELIRDADALSYFDVLIAFEYSDFPSLDDIYERMNREYKRMSKEATKFLNSFHYSCSKQLNIALKKLLSTQEQESTS